MRLWDRRVEVIIDQLKIQALDVSFTVEHEAGNLSRAQIDIFNLNSVHRPVVETSKRLTIKAGYIEAGKDTIFVGDIRKGYSEKATPDWVTRVEAFGGKKGPRSRISKSYKKNTPYSVIWNDALSAIRGDGVLSGNAKDAFNQASFREGITEILSGYAVEGNALDVLRNLARAAGLEVSVVDGECLVTLQGEPLASPAVVLSPQTGLIGSPKKDSKGVVTVRSLIIPGLRLKASILLSSNTVSGVHTIRKIRYTGDTSGNDYYADMEAV